MKGFMTKCDIHHFWKVEVKAESGDFFLFIFVFLELLIICSIYIYIFNVKNKTKIVIARDWNLLIQLIK